MGVYNFHPYLSKNRMAGSSTDAERELTGHQAGEPVFILPLSSDSTCSRFIQQILSKLVIQAIHVLGTEATW